MITEDLATGRAASQIRNSWPGQRGVPPTDRRMDRPALTARSGATGSRSRPGSARAGRACRKPGPAVLRAWSGPAGQPASGRRCTA